MAITRRALGLGLLGVSALVTGGAVIANQHPEWLADIGIGERTGIRGFIGGEKEALLANPRMIALLRRARLEVDGVVAGGVEQCRDPALLQQDPNFLWPGAEVLIEVARRSGVHIRNSAVVLRSPVVFYSWGAVADGLMRSGFAQVENGITYVDTVRLIQALVDSRPWSDLGAPQLAGHARIKSTDPNRSSSGMHFAGLAANALCGDVATAATLAPQRQKVIDLFGHMGFKTSSSQRLFEEYLSGGQGGSPMIVGYENQLLEWIIQDPQRWSSVQTSAATRPVTLYPRPTVVATHAFMSLKAEADPLLAALQTEPVQSLAWREHGFRSALGAVGAATDAAVAGRAPRDLPSVQPLPDVDVLLGLLGDLGTQPVSNQPPQTNSASRDEGMSPGGEPSDRTSRTDAEWRTTGGGDDDRQQGQD